MKFIQHFFKKEDPEIAAKIRAAAAIRMDDEARAKTRALLSEYAQMRPIRVDVAASTVSPLDRVSAFFAQHSMPVTAMVLVLTIGGSTAAAAESALPGETLYPIKVHVTEEVRATLALSPKAKADWEVSRAERRLEEAAILALIGELDDDTRTEIDTNLDAHVKTATESGDRLEKKNDPSAVEVRKNINAVLIARENILAKARPEVAATMMMAMVAPAEDPTERNDLAPQADNARAAKAEDESEETKQGHRTAAKVRIEATKKFLDRSSGVLTDQAREEAEERLKQAEESLSSGDVDDTEGNTSEASVHFDSALETVTAIETIVSISSEPNEQESHASTTDELKDELLNEDNGDDSPDTKDEPVEIRL